MLDIADFVSDRGGNPNKVKESQRKRFAPESVVDEILTLYEEARRGTFFKDFITSPKKVNRLKHAAARYEVMQIGSQLNGLQKEIGKKKKVCLTHGYKYFCSFFQPSAIESTLIVMPQTEQGRCKFPS